MDGSLTCVDCGVYRPNPDDPKICIKCDRPFDAEPLFYIQDTRSVCGNSAVWWAEGGHGYTSNLDKAWKVPGTWKERDTDVLRPCAEIDALAERHFDVQKLRSVVGA